MASQIDSVDDIAATIPSRTVKVGGALTMLSGVVALGLAIQAGALLTPIGIYRIAPPLFALFGLGAIVSGARLTRMRPGSAHSAIAVAALLTLAGLTWFALTLRSGFLLLMALALAPLALLAVIASILSVAPVARASAARTRLREQGLDSGL